MNDRYLAIYLNDHRSGMVGARELTRRSIDENRDTALGEDLQAFLAELESDAATLEELMDRVGAERDTLKAAAGWAAEKIGRLKLNGRLAGYSELSRLEELEILRLGVQGKLALWQLMRHVAAVDARLEGLDFEGLITRAERQRDLLERHRLDAGRAALLPEQPVR